MLRLRTLETGTCLLMVATILAACTVTCPPSGLEAAAAHRYTTSSALVPPEIDPHLEGRWLRNQYLEDFLRSVMRNEGVSSLSARYGLQCAPRTNSESCRDCLTCTQSFPGKGLGMNRLGILGCYDSGHMFIRAEIGPVQSVTAETYYAVPKYPDKP